MTSQHDAMQQVIDHLKAMRTEMAELAKSSDAMAEARVHEYIECASLYQCKNIVDALSVRISSILGFATALEDFSAALAVDIEAQDAIDNPPICSACNGSGEGRGDDSVCIICHGRGTGESKIK